MRRTLTAVIAAASVLSVVSESQAESAPLYCTMGIVWAPGQEAQTVPSNAPAIAYRPGIQHYPAVWTVESLALVAPNGTGLPLTIKEDPLEEGGALVAWGSQPAEGDYQLSWVESCEGSGKIPPTPKDRVLKIGPAVAWPSPIGSLERVAQDSTNVRLRTKFSAETLAYLAVADVSISWTDESPMHRWYGLTGGDIETTLHLPCGVEGNITKTAQLTVHVAGAESDPPPVQMDVAYNCSTTSSEDDGGCSCSSVPSRRTPLWFVLSLALAMLVRARRFGSWPRATA